MRAECCVRFQSLPTVNGFLDAAIAALPGWRKILPNYPVVSWLSFVEYIRATVNSLASDGHIRELVCQLQLVGEVLTLAFSNISYVVYFVYHPCTDSIMTWVVFSSLWVCGCAFVNMVTFEPFDIAS